jgi:hypothetical protein
MPYNRIDVKGDVLGDCCLGMVSMALGVRRMHRQCLFLQNQPPADVGCSRHPGRQGGPQACHNVIESKTGLRCIH